MPQIMTAEEFFGKGGAKTGLPPEEFFGMPKVTEDGELQSAVDQLTPTNEAMPIPSKATGFWGRIDTDVEKRANNIEKIQNRPQMPIFSGIGQAGEVAGLGVDTLGNLIASAARSVPFSESIGEGAGYVGSQLADTVVGRKVGDALNYLGTGAKKFADRHPITAQTINAVGNIANLVPAIGATAKAAEGISKATTPAASAAPKVAKKLVSTVTPSIDEGLRESGRLAQKYDIPLSLDQLSRSPTLKNAQKISQEVPLSGQAAFRDKQLSAFNRALLRTVGQEGDKITPLAMDKAFSQVGKEFDDLGRGKVFNLNNFEKRVQEITDNAQLYATNDAKTSLVAVVQKVREAAGRNGDITGENLGALRRKINMLGRKATDSDTRELLRDLEGAVIDTMTVGDDAAKEAFSATKQKYKNLLVIEPLAAKAAGGNISPALLNNRVAKIYGRAYTRGKAGEIGDLARVGRDLLPELGGSDTTQKLAYIGALTSMAANPAITPSIVIGTMANRALQSGVNRNQALISRLLSGDKSAIKELSKLPPEEGKAIVEQIKKGN